MIKEAIILAGGLGTRLRSVISDVPKCMAPVAEKPFLAYVISYLKKEGVQNFTFSLGYKSDVIIDFISSQFPMLDSEFSIENEPLGTGGAIKLACRKATQQTVLIVNGDTLFSIHLDNLFKVHKEHKADCTLCLKPMKNFDRYGVVDLNEDHSVKSFNEKRCYVSGLINGGVYALEAKTFLKEDLPLQFSFEKEYLEKFYSKGNIYGLVEDEYFIDIGIPEDYERAQKELKVMSYEL